MFKLLAIILMLSSPVLALDLCGVKRRLMADRVCAERHKGVCPNGANAMMANCFPYPFGFNCGCGRGKKNASYKSASVLIDDLFTCSCSCEKEEF